MPIQAGTTEISLYNLVFFGTFWRSIRTGLMANTIYFPGMAGTSIVLTSLVGTYCELSPLKIEFPFNCFSISLKIVFKFRER